ncbi:MAG: hypothetical protein U0491_03610 [Candidatus Saccharimonadales bacterium]
MEKLSIDKHELLPANLRSARFCYPSGTTFSEGFERSIYEFCNKSGITMMFWPLEPEPGYPVFPELQFVDGPWFTIQSEEALIELLEKLVKNF